MRVPITVHFDEADPGGILFFGRVLTLAHRAFETAVVPRLVSGWDAWFRSDAFLVPIRHAEATFTSPLRPGRAHAAVVEVTAVGTTSFEVHTRFVEEGEEGDRLCAETRVTHVFTDPATFAKRPIPEAIRRGLVEMRDSTTAPSAGGAGTSRARSAGSR